MRAFDRDLIRGRHYGQRPRVPRSKAGHMAAPTAAAFAQKSLDSPEPSTHGPASSRSGAGAKCGGAHRLPLIGFLLASGRHCLEKLQQIRSLLLSQSGNEALFGTGCLLGRQT